MLLTVLLAACANSVAPAGVDTAHTIPAGTATVVSPQVVAAPTISTTTTAGEDISTQAFAQSSILLVNQARHDAGLEPLVENPVLTEIARSYSRRMAAEGFYGHEDPQGRDVTDRIVDAGYLAQISAENIAAGQPDPETVVDGWLNSPGHRANILNPDLREIGQAMPIPHHHPTSTIGPMSLPRRMQA